MENHISGENPMVMLDPSAIQLTQCEFLFKLNIVGVPYFLDSAFLPPHPALSASPDSDFHDLTAFSDSSEWS